MRVSLAAFRIALHSRHYNHRERKLLAGTVVVFDAAFRRDGGTAGERWPVNMQISFGVAVRNSGSREF